MLSAPCGLFHSLQVRLLSSRSNPPLLIHLSFYSFASSFSPSTPQPSGKPAQPPLPLLLAAMNHVVLSKLAWTDKSPAVKLRLLHTWMAGNPSRPDGFSEYATLWTDELGVLVQGLASKLLSDQLKEVLSVGKIYFVTQFSQREAKKRWAPCSNDRLLHFTSSTTFVLADEDASSFCADSFEFRRFEDLHGIASRAEHLVDAVGRLVSATPVTYFQKQHRSIKKQTVVIENERGASLPVTLWAEFADRLPLAQLIQLDGAAPIVVAFTSLNLSLWRASRNRGLSWQGIHLPTVPSCGSSFRLYG
ncbi:unnamed protein product [Linum tenue]|uniref:Uncharacterized protein n=1 Tax=Linum tenue TaxID=586396 RepID=A0AAV0LT49_9ROSI|nr:unnamed protein product [Linum tenue]